MVKLRKKHSYSYAYSSGMGTDVYAYEARKMKRDDWRSSRGVALPDNTRVVSHTEEEEKLHRAHRNSETNVAAMAVGGAIMGGPKGMTVSGGVGLVIHCYTKCHAQSPPKKP